MFRFIFSVRLQLREATVLLDLIIALIKVPGTVYDISSNVVTHIWYSIGLLRRNLLMVSSIIDARDVRDSGRHHAFLLRSHD